VTFWLRIIARIGRSGVDLKDLEDFIVSEFGLSLSMARYYVRSLKKEGLIRYKRPYRNSKRYGSNLQNKLQEF